MTLARKPCCGDAAPSDSAPDLNALAQAVSTNVGVYVQSATQLAGDENSLSLLQTALANDTQVVAAAKANVLAALGSLQAALSV